jgi:hypothetical protein
MTSPLPQHASMHGSPSIFHLNAPRGRGGTDVRVQEVRAGPWCFRDPAMDGQPDRRGPRPGKTGTGSGIKTWVKERHYYPQASSKPKTCPPMGASWSASGKTEYRDGTGQDRTGPKAPRQTDRHVLLCDKKRAALSNRVPVSCYSSFSPVHIQSFLLAFLHLRGAAGYCLPHLTLPA